MTVSTDGSPAMTIENVGLTGLRKKEKDLAFPNVFS
jgi:hypothetical protein